MPELSLAGRSALVTGASRGIGLAIARCLGAAGARLALIARSIDALEDEARSLGPQALAISCDVADQPSVEAAVDRARAHFGAAPEILVNNAGEFVLAALDETAADAFVRTIDVNLVAPFRFVRAFAREMRDRASGHIVTIGSIADRTVFPENGAYAASKHAARAMHEVLRLEMRGTGVRATLVSPGPVDTALWDPIDPDTRPGFTPRAQMLGADAVADAVRWAVTRPPESNIDEIRLSRA
jgi:NADP-dependent 3-hydroxy acid dehydrogenase YdfG